MRKNLFIKILIIFTFAMIGMMLYTSPSYAAYKFVTGANTVTAEEYKITGVTFTVDTTGIYSITILPTIEDYEWKYVIKNEDNGGKTISVAVLKDGQKDPVYKLYSDTIPYVYLVAGNRYTIKAEGNDKNKLIMEGGSQEQYVTIKLSAPTINKNGKYYEAYPDKLSKTLEKLEDNKKDKFPLACNNSNSAAQSGSKFVNPVSNDQYPIYGAETKADLLQQLLTSFLVNVVGDGAMFLIGVVAGEPITIDSLLFNQYTRIRLAFFEQDYKVDESKQNQFLMETGLLPNDKNEGTINMFYNRFTVIAIIAYLVILLYMGIKILLSTTGKDTAKYKKLFFDWVCGIMILFLFPYVMRYTIKINDAVVSYIATLRNSGGINIDNPEIIDYPGGLAFPFSYVGSEGVNTEDYMSKMRTNAVESGKVIYALCWLLMIKELVAFLIIYMKRLLMTLFLIVIFPLVTISYAIDKIGDGKSQAFNNWVKEFILNVFLQTFHAINYVVVMGIIFSISNLNFIFILIGLTYLSKGDKLLRGIFAHLKGGGGNSVKDTTETMMAAAGAVHMIKSSVSTLRKGIKTAKDAREKRLDRKDKASRIEEKKTDDEWDSFFLAPLKDKDTREAVPDADNKLKNAMNVVLDKNSSAEQVQKATRYLAKASKDKKVKDIYTQQMNNLRESDQDRYNELNGIMEQSQAVDALQNMDNLTEAEINANLDVLIRNRTKDGAYAKLDAELQKKGVSRSSQNDLKNILKQRELSAKQEAELARVKKSICTKDDAMLLGEMKKIDAEKNEILQNRRKSLEESAKKLEEKLQKERT